MRYAVSQETCLLWYGDFKFQITRFDCTEIIFRQSNCIDGDALDFLFPYHFILIQINCKSDKRRRRR